MLDLNPNDNLSYGDGASFTPCFFRRGGSEDHVEQHNNRISADHTEAQDNTLAEARFSKQCHPSLEEKHDLPEQDIKKSSSESLLKRVWRATLGSPGTLISSGATLITAASGQTYSSYFFLGVTILGVVNRFLQRSAESNDSNPGIIKLVKDFVLSPTIDFKGSTAYWMLATSEACVGNPQYVIPYLSFCLGEYWAGKLQERKLNNSDGGNENSKSGVLYKINDLFGNWSSRLTNPAVYFSVGNIILNLSYAGASIPQFSVGIIFSGAAMLAALWPQQDPKLPPNGFAYRMQAGSHLGFVLGNLLTGNYWYALAFSMFVPTALMQAVDQDRELRRAVKKGRDS